MSGAVLSEPTVSFPNELAEAYREAALAGMEMARATAAFERMRAATAAATDIHTIADALNGVVNDSVEVPALAAMLARLRASWIDAAVERIIAGLATKLASDPSTGTIAWIVTIGDAIAAFRFDIARRIAAADLRLPPETTPRPTEIAERCGYALDARWREAQPMLEQLGDDARLSPLARSRALCYLAEVLAMVRSDRDHANKIFERAAELAPDDWRVSYTHGRLIEEANQPEATTQARAEYEKAADAAPDTGMLQVQLGQLLLKQENITAAESRFLAAARATVGPENGYGALIDLCGRKELFPARNREIGTLVDRALLAARQWGSGYDPMLSAARAFEANGDESAALVWFDRAIQRFPERTAAYVNRGFFHLDKTRLDAAREDFTHVTTIAAGSVDGWWGLLNWAEPAQQWLCVLRYAARCLARAPEWREALRERLEKIAKALYDTHRQPRMARAYYRFLRRWMGESYEPSYRNLIGNLLYYQTNYRAAATEYRLAEKTHPTEPRYPSNLALALEAALAAEEAAGTADSALVTATLDESVAAVERAREQATGSDEFAAQQERLTRARRFTVLFGAPARLLVTDETKLRVLVHPALTPLVSDGSGLTAAWREAIGALRTQVMREHGFTLCGVSVREMEDGAAPPDSWMIEIAGQSYPHAHFDVSQGAEALAAVALSAINAQLPELLWADEAREVALRQPDGDAIVADPGLLVAFTAAIRTHLREKGRVDPPAMDVLPTVPPPPPAEASAGAVMSFHLSPDVVWSDEFDRQLQSTLFARSGVLMMRPAQLTDPALGPGPHWRATIGSDGPAVCDYRTLPGPEAEIVEELLPHTASLLGPEAAAHQLDALARSYPALISCARALLPMQVLLAALRTELTEGRSLAWLRLIELWVMDWQTLNARVGEQLGAVGVGAPDHGVASA